MVHFNSPEFLHFNLCLRDWILSPHVEVFFYLPALRKCFWNCVKCSLLPRATNLGFSALLSTLKKSSLKRGGPEHHYHKICILKISSGKENTHWMFITRGSCEGSVKKQMREKKVKSTPYWSNTVLQLHWTAFPIISVFCNSLIDYLYSARTLN